MDPSHPTKMPPYYILLANSPFESAPSTSTGSGLTHPTSIHYHYADDPPLDLLPSHVESNPNDVVLVMEYNESEPSEPPTVRSLSQDMVVSGVRVSTAPGVGMPVTAGTNPTGAPMELHVDGNMYVIETISSPNSRKRIVTDPLSALAKFRQSNEHLRRGLEYGLHGPTLSATTTPEPLIPPPGPPPPAPPPTAVPMIDPQVMVTSSPRPFKSPRLGS